MRSVLRYSQTVLLLLHIIAMFMSIHCRVVYCWIFDFFSSALLPEYIQHCVDCTVFFSFFVSLLLLFFSPHFLLFSFHNEDENHQRIDFCVFFFLVSSFRCLLNIEIVKPRQISVISLGFCYCCCLFYTSNQDSRNLNETKANRNKQPNFVRH